MTEQQQTTLYEPDPFYANYIKSKKGWGDLPLDLPCRGCFAFNGLDRIDGPKISVECETPNELLKTDILPSDVKPELRKIMGSTNYKIKLGHRCFMKKIW